MRGNLAAGILAGLALVATLVGYSASFTVYQTENRHWWCVSVSQSERSPSQD
jgi:hypothetical protein